MTIHERLQKRRKELRLSLEQVSCAAGVNKSTVLRWETGELQTIRSDKIKKLADVLKCTPAYLLGWEEEPEIDTPAVPERAEEEIRQLFILYGLMKEDEPLPQKIAERLFEIFKIYMVQN